MMPFLHDRGDGPYLFIDPFIHHGRQQSSKRVIAAVYVYSHRFLHFIRCGLYRTRCDLGISLRFVLRSLWIVHIAAERVFPGIFRLQFVNRMVSRNVWQKFMFSLFWFWYFFTINNTEVPNLWVATRPSSGESRAFRMGPRNYVKREKNDKMKILLSKCWN